MTPTGAVALTTDEIRCYIRNKLWRIIPRTACIPADRAYNTLDGISSPPDLPEGPGGVIFFMMMTAPPNPQAIAFVDGQNLFYAGKQAFGYRWPNYDPVLLAQSVCRAKGWALVQVRFYTGVPDKSDNPLWHQFWAAKLLDMSRKKVHVFSRALRYNNRTIKLPDGTQCSFLVGQEKGIDVRLALDVVSLALARSYDVAVIFSQDQDLTEAVDEVKAIAGMQTRWIKVACAFPASPTSTNKRGINKTDWIKIARTEYDSCLDPKDYRPSKPNP